MGATGNFKITIPISEDSEIPPTEETQLIPTSCAQFPGSFAPDLREDKRRVSKRSGFSDRIYIFFTDGWGDVTVWKSAFIEFVGTTCLCYLSAFISIAIRNSDTTQIAAYVGVTNIFLLTLFICALAPASGGHMNPIITFATVITGLTGFPRGMLYMIGQTTGAALAGGLIRGSLGDQRTLIYNGGGCFLETTSVSEGQAYLIESIFSCIMLILSFGTALDPRQAQLFGPRLGPFMVGCTLGFVSFSSINLAPEYPGAGLNPARCFAFAVARGNFAYQWIWWFGPVTGAIIQSSVYHFAPPYHRERVDRRHST
ncbi:hypothetical protein BELL_0341g00080 [Botrytis elliptica]|uniref:Aquaporin n=1 Tax=Botrytis elliptica TaxID=278938 RepID=A0A4Z1JXL5_9HELO|nr:hypothetical protein EAE99_009850 [Botrytis elliptica]TGO73677.1 hypothetical protein BELL_0341g00080 [Botrytis elliptica]